MRLIFPDPPGAMPHMLSPGQWMSLLVMWDRMGQLRSLEDEAPDPRQTHSSHPARTGTLGTTS